MLRFFFELEPSHLMVLAMAAMLLVIWLTGLVARRMPDSPRSAASLDAFRVVVTFTGLMLAFALVQAQTGIRIAQASASREAGAMNQLDRVLLRFGTPGTVAIRPLLKDYMTSVIEEDWPALDLDTASPATAARLATLNRAIQTLQDGVSAKPALYAEMLKQLDGINDARQDRVDVAGSGVPPELYEAVIGLFVILVVLSMFIQVPARIMVLAGPAVAVALLASLVVVLDRPYRGPAAVTPIPISRVLTAIATRTS